ncbi:DUF3794 domain-containing protein [bacterium 1XD42-8]|nr:DUF3794 domain-containing protein [bacterium 1XD42-8]
MKQKELESGGIFLELIKKNVHMDRKKCSAVTQLTVDDDYNIPDGKSDIDRVILDKGEIRIDEVKASEDHVNIKGCLHFSLLYQSGATEKNIHSLDGEVEFEEFVHMEGAKPGDTPIVKSDLEDLTINVINNRKLSIQAITTLHVSIEELFDEETTVDILCAEMLEYRKKPMDIVEIAVQKKDIYRIKEEIVLPSNLPNIFEILWESVRLEQIELKPLDGKISVQGEVAAFILYEAEGEEAKVQWHESRLPFSGTVDCHGCVEGMISDIAISAIHKELEMKPDYDGEERVVAIDMVLDLDIKLYKEEFVEILTDVYGVTKEVETRTQIGSYKNLRMKNSAKCREDERIRINNTGARILQICTSEGTVKIDETQIMENGIKITGAVEVQVLYVTADDKIPFFSMKGSIPFEHTIEIPGIEKNSIYEIESSLEQLITNMIDSEEIEVKIVLNLQALVFDKMEENIISEISLKDLDPEKLKDLPGIVGYIVKEGDTLWQIGKKYYVSIQQLKELNELNTPEVKAGDKLLIVKTLGQL